MLAELTIRRLGRVSAPPLLALARLDVAVVDVTRVDAKSHVGQIRGSDADAASQAVVKARRANTAGQTAGNAPGTEAASQAVVGT